MRKLKNSFPLQKKQRMDRAGFFLRYAKSRGFSEHYYPSGTKFFNHFKPVLLRGKNRSFLLDIKRTNAIFPICVSINFNKRDSRSTTVPLFEARISFQPKVVSIESLQGGKALVEMREFDALVGIPASRYLVKEIIEQAKRMKYKQVRLIRPEANVSYNLPVWVQELDKRGKKLHDIINFGNPTIEESQEYEVHKQEAVSTIRARMKKLYGTIAVSEGFRVEGNYFVKDL